MAEGAKAAAQSPDVKQVSAQEMQVAFSGPAILSNRFFVTLGAAGARRAFAEQSTPETQPVFRAAVVMPFQDAIELARVLRLVLSDIEKQLVAAKADADAKTKAKA